MLRKFFYYLYSLPSPTGGIISDYLAPKEPTRVWLKSRRGVWCRGASTTPTQRTIFLDPT
jgi:hypothetical protein